jgi:hypothetical protein
VLTSLQALLRLATLRWLGVFVCALAMLLATASTASALEPAQTKTRVWGFDFAADNSVGLFRAASSGKHQGNRLAEAEEASGSLLAAGGAATVIRYSPISPGPLPAAIANTFRGGSYTATTLNEATTLYRVYGGTAGKVGSYWTRTAPSGPLQSTIDLALNPQWGNTATQVARMQVPAGTTIFEGAAAAQGGLVGGGSQVFIQNVNPAWLLP